MLADRHELKALILSGLLLFVLTVFSAVYLKNDNHDAVIGLQLLEGPVYALAVWLLLRLRPAAASGDDRRLLVVTLAIAVLTRAVLLGEPPISTDLFRYVWDGRVSAAGVNPYRYVPIDPDLAALRDEIIYPNINRADYARTIYPPMAQLIFLVTTRLSESVTMMKIAMTAFDLLAMGAIISMLRSRRMPACRVLIYAWHPLPLFEFAGSAHLDAVSIAFFLLAFILADRRYPALAGILLASATLVKYFPILLAPALYRRFDWRFPLAGLCALGLIIAPFLGAGHEILDFLPVYADEQGMSDGVGFFPLALLKALIDLPPQASIVYLAIGALLLLAIGFRTLMRPNLRQVDLPAAMTLLVCFTVMLSPHLPWYYTWTTPFLCFYPSAALIYIGCMAPLVYDIIWSPDQITLYAVVFVPAGILFLVERAWTLRGKRPRLRAAASQDGFVPQIAPAFVPEPDAGGDGARNA